MCVYVCNFFFTIFIFRFPASIFFSCYKIIFYFFFEIKQEILRKLNVKIKEKDYKILEIFFEVNALVSV